MSVRVQRASVWGGLLMVLLFFVGLGLVAQFIPPPSPEKDAAAVAQMFDEDRVRIRIGLFIAAAAAVLLVPLFATIGVQMRRIEGKHSPLAFGQMMLGALLVPVFMSPMFVWQAAAYRPERAVEITQALNDLAWLPFVGIVWTVTLQVALIAIAILGDRRKEPVFPRWAGYVCAWEAFATISGSFVVFTKTGPLAWDGVIGWWFLIVSFFVWLCVMSFVLWRAIAQQEREDADEWAGSRELPLDAGERIDRLSEELAALRKEIRTS